MPTTESPAIVEPGPGLATADAGEPRFWVIDPDLGLVAYDLDGNRLSSLAIVGDDVRRLPDGRLVALATDEDERLWLSVFDGEGQLLGRTAVANGIDLETCTVSEPDSNADDDYAGLAVQSQRDFKIDLRSNHACLTLMDRNANMADVELSVAVDLATGQAQAVIGYDINGSCEVQELGGDPCADSRVGEAWVEAAPAPAPAPPPAPPNEWQFSFDETTHWLSEGGKQRARLCASLDEPDGSEQCSGLEEASPSGRFLWLSGRWDMGDYIYRELVLLDRSTGVLMKVRDDGEGPPELIEVEAAQLFVDSGEGTLSLIGESDVGWLPGDRLWVDGFLLIPERRAIVPLGGRRVLEPRPA